MAIEKAMANEEREGDCIFRLENTLTVVYYILLLGGPYIILLFKGLNLRLKLFFVAFGELFVWCMLCAVDAFINSDSLLYFLYGYSMIVWMIILAHLALMLISWIFGKIKLRMQK
jgi:hypothetical protein